MEKIDYRLYLVTDEECLVDKDLYQAVEEALAAGVTLVQYRAKNALGGEMYTKALALKGLCDRYRVPLIINDRLDVAMAIGAAGVHLGQEDLPVKAARSLVGPDFIIGATAHNIPEAKQAVAEGANYLGCGAVYATSTKRNTVPLGLEGLKAIRGAISVPMVGIAGITTTNYKPVLATGVQGIAVVSAILGAKDIKAAVKEFLG